MKQCHLTTCMRARRRRGARAIGATAERCHAALRGPRPWTHVYGLSYGFLKSAVHNGGQWPFGQWPLLATFPLTYTMAIWPTVATWPPLCRVFRSCVCRLTPAVYSSRHESWTAEAILFPLEGDARGRYPIFNSHLRGIGSQLVPTMYRWLTCFTTYRMLEEVFR